MDFISREPSRGSIEVKTVSPPDFAAMRSKEYYSHEAQGRALPSVDQDSWDVFQETSSFTNEDADPCVIEVVRVVSDSVQMFSGHFSTLHPFVSYFIEKMSVLQQKLEDDQPSDLLRIATAHEISVTLAPFLYTFEFEFKYYADFLKKLQSVSSSATSVEAYLFGSNFPRTFLTHMSQAEILISQQKAVSDLQNIGIHRIYDHREIPTSDAFNRVDSILYQGATKSIIHTKRIGRE